MGLAHGTGGLFRAFGPETLEKDQRRDGLPFLLVLLAIAGAVVRVVLHRTGRRDDHQRLHRRARCSAASRSSSRSAADPRGLAVPASRIVHDNGRIGIGFGLVHPHDRGLPAMSRAVVPQPSHGLPALSQAGGLFGWMIGEPLAMLLTDVGAYIVLES